VSASIGGAPLSPPASLSLSLLSLSDSQIRGGGASEAPLLFPYPLIPLPLLLRFALKIGLVDMHGQPAGALVMRESVREVEREVARRLEPAVFGLTERRRFKGA
jgi:hypothetical protein